MRILGVIPARGNSKGVPRKNIRDLAGKPLIAHTIEAANASRGLTRTIVSTDNAEIAEVARASGADVPFRRPDDLATDSAGAIETMQHALDACEAEEGEAYDALMMLQPTTPFRQTGDIDGAIALFVEKQCDSVISVVDVEGHHPARMKYMRDGMLIDPPFCEARENQPRQELEAMYIRNGAIYLTRSAVLRANSFKGGRCAGFAMPLERSINIDTLYDFDLAAWIAGRLAAGAD